ncbi:tyrosine-type recombinase/integrase [Chloroflexota bacterium]
MTITISRAISKYINNITLTRSQNTARSYGNALRSFKLLLNKRDLTTENTMVRDLPVDAIAWFAMDLKKYAPATESLYLTAVAGFFEYLAAENLSDPNLPKLRMLIKQRSRRYGSRLPQFPRSQIEEVLNYAAALTTLPHKNEAEGLRNLRDRAFLLTLADTGLRVHEICDLRRGDIDWNEGKAVIIGKGDRQDVVRFSNRCMKAIRDYLNVRAVIDGASGRPLSSLPVFSRHDRGAGNKIKPITTATGRNIVSQRVKEVLGSQSVGKITPHSFRHYFVTTVLHGSGGKLKLAQELARHRNIAVTQRYAHLSDDELDRGYWEIFEER